MNDGGPAAWFSKLEAYALVAMQGLVKGRLDQGQNLVAAALKAAGIDPLKIGFDEFAKDHPEMKDQVKICFDDLWKDLAEQCFDIGEAMLKEYKRRTKPTE